MSSISRDELLALAKNHNGALVGGNVCAKVNGSSVWLAVTNDGVFSLTREGREFIQAMTDKPAPKAVKAPAKKATPKAKSTPEVSTPTSAIEPATDDDDLLEGL